MTNVLDTFLNLFVFAYIGLLIWLYIKERPSGQGHDTDENRQGP